MANNVLEFFVKMKDMMSGGLVKMASTAQSSFSKVQSELDKTISRNKVLSESFEQLQKRIKATENTISTSTITSQIRQAKRELAELKKLEGRHAGNISGVGGFGKGGGLMGSIVGGNLISDGIQSVTNKVTDFVGGSYSKAMQNKALSNAINTTTGGQGAEAMAQTRSIADKYGINYEASLEGVKTLTGGLMSMNMPLREQMKIFEGVSTGVAAMGLTAEQSKGALLALGQMASKVTVSAEELRGQLGERIPGAFGLAAKAMGVTESKLNDMLQSGDIAAKDFLPKLAAEMQKTFGADALKNANGPQAIQERFNNAMYDMQVAIGQGLIPLITPVLQMLTALAIEVMPYISSGLNQVANFLSGINISGEDWAFYMEWVKRVIGIIWNGISYVAGAIWNILKGVFKWAAQSEIIKDVFSVIADQADITWTVIKKVADLLGWIWSNVVSPMLNGIEKAYRWIKELIGGGSKEIKVTDATKPGLAQVATPSSSVTPSKGSMAKIDAPKAKEDVAKGITDGGPKTINISGVKFADKIEIHASSADEGLSNLEARMKEMYMRILNSGAAIA